MTTTKLSTAALSALTLTACATSGPSASGPIPTTPGHILMEMSEARPDRMSGELDTGDTFAVHTITASHGAVLQADVDGPVRSLRAGTALAAAVLSNVRTDTTALPQESARIVWCDVNQYGGGLYDTRHANCFSDENDDGRFDKAYIGVNDDRRSYYDMRRFGALPETSRNGQVDVPYRSAEPHERPSTQIAFRYCEGSNDRSPPRFALVEATDRGWDTRVSPCAFGSWPAHQPSSTVTLTDGISLEVEQTGGGLSYTVNGRFEAGLLSGLLARLEPRRFGGDASMQTPTGRRLLVSPSQVPVVGDAPAEVFEGMRSGGTPLLQQQVRFRHSGILANEVQESAPFPLRGRRLDVGTPVFGLPLVTEGAQDARRIALIWCAPRVEGSGADTTTDAVCLPYQGLNSIWTRVRTGFFPTSIMVESDRIYASLPIVDRREVDFGYPLVRKAVLREWTSRRAIIDIVLEAGPETHSLGRVTAIRSEDGSATLELMGRVIRITQAPGEISNLRTYVELIE